MQPNDPDAQADYSGGGIVNLMQSLAQAGGAPAARYAQCAGLPAERLADARHIALLVIDGLGLPALDRLPESSSLRRHLIGSLSSVFPSTTASAITTFMTGLAPAQHGLTGWHMYLEEIGQMLAILPLTPRDPGETLALPAEELPPRLFTYPTVFQQMTRESWVIAPQRIAGSPFNAWHARGAGTRAYSALPEMFGHLSDLLKNAPAPRYLYAYYPDLDSVSHRFGCDSRQAQEILLALDKAFDDFLATSDGTDAWLIVTADHGFIDSPPERVVSLDDHPRLAAWLSQPLSGERRVAYCHVTAAHQSDFAEYVRQHLAHCAELHASADLIRAGWFGPPPYHPQLALRMGDYTLVMKENWTITDWLPGEKRYRLLGVHGGISRQEMRVPLIALRL